MRNYAAAFYCRVATVRENLLENDFFSRSGKTRDFVVGQGNFESQGI